MSLVLRDVMFMMMMASAIFVFAGFFINEMAINYDNTNMSNEWALSGTNVTGNAMFSDNTAELEAVGDGLKTDPTGLYGLVSSVANALDGIGEALMMVLNAPATIGNLVSGMLTDANVPTPLPQMVKFLIVGVFWGIIIFTIISAFLRGGKL